MSNMISQIIYEINSLFLKSKYFIKIIEISQFMNDKYIIFTLEKIIIVVNSKNIMMNKF